MEDVMNGLIIGRESELKILDEIYESVQAEFIAVYGRRRIGKTYLISEYFRNKGLYFEITGMKDSSMRDQLYQFAYEYSRQFNQGDRIPTPKSWGEAFTLLNDAIEKNDQDKKIILFFDEIPWLASPRSKFLNALDHCWNRYLSRHKNVILVICGSSASWIIKNIINDKGGLHGRVTRKIRLLPFSLAETERYLQYRNIELDRKQIIDLYMAIGGVPKYLAAVPRGKSAAQIVSELCFSRNGILFEEFNNLYRSLFDHFEHHIEIVRALALSNEGLTGSELLGKVKMSSGGTASKILQELIDAGFLIYVPTFNKKKVGGVYRLIDEYSLFYLIWIKEIGIQGTNDPEFWLKQYGSSRWLTWSGLAFEAVCYKHVNQIKKGLGIIGITTVDSSWRHIAKNKDERGAQIDLVIDRADRSINLCEMKYSDSEFTIDGSYSTNLQNKKVVFREQTGTTKTLFMTLVTTFGVKKNSQYLSVVNNQLTMNDLFV
jgi:AAA+ ATPase superfamily predicted ATPase